MKFFWLLLLFIIGSQADKQFSLHFETDDAGKIKNVITSNNLELDHDIDNQDEERTDKTSPYYGMPWVVQTEGSSGYMYEVYDADYEYCNSWTNAPGINTWSSTSKGLLIFMALLYAFLGVSIVADTFMASIEVITAQEVVVTRRVDQEEFGEQEVKIHVRVWNETVANLTLLALGSSAPEILLALLETMMALMNGEEAGELGPSTIVGSAAFNLFVITAVCAVSVPEGEERRIDQMGVFYITAFSSVWAYLWLWLAIVIISPDQIDLWEGYITLLMFPFLVGVAYSQDVRLFEEGKEANFKISASVQNKVDDLAKNQELADIDAKDVAANMQKDMLASRSPLWWRINGARYLQGKMPLIKPGDKVEIIPEKEEKKEFTELDPLATYKEKLEDTSRFETVFNFSNAQFTVREDEGSIKIPVFREGNCSGTDSVYFETINGTAEGGEDFASANGNLIFNPNDKVAYIEIEIFHDEDVEDNEFFALQLSNPTGNSAGIGKTRLANVIIIDVSDPGHFAFPAAATQCSERCGTVRIPVQRTNGSNDRVTVDFETRPGQALPGANFERTFGTLEFQNNECLKYIEIKIKDNKVYDEQDLDFNLVLSNPTNKSEIANGKGSINISITDDKQRSKIVQKVFDLLGSGYDLGTHSWREQFEEAMSFEGEPGNYTAMVLHCVTFPWKVLFAFIPPTSYYNGWLTFGCSLAAVGAVTFVIGALATVWGCFVGLGDAIVALSIVALGTSMPDLFASVTATVMAPNADAAIGNVTGSNSVNVFLGQGLPWCVATFYHASQGTTYKVPQGTLSFAVSIFVPMAIICLGTLTYREYSGTGALGGTVGGRKVMACFFVCLWVTFLTLSYLKGEEIL